jgi:hypothetical protein
MCASPAASSGSGHDRRQFAQRSQTLVVVGPQMAFAGDPGPTGEMLGHPARLLQPIRHAFATGQPQGQAIRHPAAVPAGEVGARQAVAALFRPAPTQRHQRGKVAVAGAVAGQQHQLHAAGEGQFGAVDQFQRLPSRGKVGTYAAGETALVGDRQRRIAQLDGPRHQFLGVGSPAQEAEVGNAMEFGVGRQGRHGGSD